jgi:hypothetical protein
MISRIAIPVTMLRYAQGTYPPNLNFQVSTIHQDPSFSTFPASTVTDRTLFATDTARDDKAVKGLFLITHGT